MLIIANFEAPYPELTLFMLTVFQVFPCRFAPAFHAILEILESLQRTVRHRQLLTRLFSYVLTERTVALELVFIEELVSR